MGLKCDLDKIWYSFNPALRPSDLSDQFCDVFSLTSLNQVHDIRETTFQSIKYPFPDMIPIHSFCKLSYEAQMPKGSFRTSSQIFLSDSKSSFLVLFLSSNARARL